ncbi:TetR/AcrR family transcriptional regulator [Actinophytocola glycyrrhizae]|uniref:TetR/AcrR family transcriptional regulator n=1 Tax=Actinophytocola glycyrrhizae TaxID=2044873 RepID=A0ABV9RWD8_9PSEU
MSTHHEPLPRGRHGLTRDQVRDSQRARLLLGMAESVAEHGYPRATVATVLNRVHVSRETFYQHFSDKEDCFLAVLDESAKLLASALAAGAGTATGPALPRLERVLTTYFTTLSEQVPFARVFFVESYAAGIPAQRKRVEVQERFVDLMVTAFADSPEWRTLPDPRFACRLVVGGISSLVSAALIKGEAATLPGTAPKVVELVRHLVSPGAESSTRV